MGGVMLGGARKVPDHTSPDPQCEFLLLTHICNGKKWPFSTCIMMHEIFLLNSSKNFRHCHFSSKETHQTLMTYKAEALPKPLPSIKDIGKSNISPEWITLRPHPSQVRWLWTSQLMSVPRFLLCNEQHTMKSSLRPSLLTCSSLSAHEQNVSEQPELILLV